MNCTGKRARAAIGATVGLVVMAAASLGGTTGAGAVPSGPPSRTAPVLDHVRHGRDALTRLEAGGHLDDVAAKAGWSEADLRSTLRGDESLHVQPDGLSYYVDAASEVAAAGTGTAASDGPVTAALGTIDPQQTFLLHSLPGPRPVIYLDFVGYVSTTGGGTFTAFDLDGATPCAVGTSDPACFGTTELETIQAIWARVAEAYAAFDVDVTTEDPGTNGLIQNTVDDRTYGVRMMLGDGNGPLATGCTAFCRGLAYVGIFDQYFASDVGGLVRVPNFAPKSVRDLALVAVHEVGHTLGLQHTSLGEQSDSIWAPVMTGIYVSFGGGAPLRQFANQAHVSGLNAEYDSIAQITGVVPRTDEASPVVEADPNFVAHGVISTPTDQDTIAFTVPEGAGPTSIVVSPPAHSALDVAATLTDASSAVVATSDPAAARIDDDTASGLDASINTTLAAGTYTLTVDGVGLTGQYSDYGSIGSYTVSVVTTLTPPPSGVSVGGAAVAEGNSGKPRTLTFPVVLPDPATSTVTVHYSIEADDSPTAATGCATAAACASGGDFRIKSGTLTFKPALATGKTPTVKYVNALVYPDTTDTTDETFRVVLSDPVGVALGTDTATGTILNDDGAATPSVSIGDESVPEGDSAVKVTTTNAGKVWVTLSEPATGPVSVQVTITPTGAAAGTDFKFGSLKTVFPATKTITFAAGQWQKPVAIGVFPDTAAEGNETVALTLTNASGANLGRTAGTFTILDDD